MAKVNIFGIAGICVFGLALLFAVLTVSLVKWQTGKITLAGTESDLKVGLWEVCVEGAGIKYCADVDDSIIQSLFSDEVLDSNEAVRAMVILGILLILGAIVCGVLAMFVLPKLKVLYFVTGGLGIAAGLFLMVGMVVYVDKVKFDDLDFDAAFALDIAAWTAAWIGGVLVVIAKMTEKD